MEIWYHSSMLVSLLPTSMFLFIITAFIVIRNVFLKRTRKLRPPGPLGLPIIGHLHLLGRLPHQSLYELSKVHGPLMSLRLGSVPLVVSSSPEMAREILKTHELTFANRLPIAAAKNIFGEGKEMAFSPPNAYWKLMREEERRALMRSVLADSVNARPQQMRRKLQGTMIDIMMRMTLGKRFSEIGGKQGSHKTARIGELIEETFELLGTFNVGDFLPCMAWMDLQGCDRRSKRVGAEIRAVFDGIINARRLANKDGGLPPNDFLDVLLQASATSHTPIHIIEALLDFIIAGSEPITISIEWVLAMLLLNPDKLRIVQEEIDEVVGRARLIEEEDIAHLPFFIACVKETMRLYPVAPLLIPHKNDKACEIMGFHIPANTQAYVSTWAIGRDPKIWENPTRFSPERFLKTSSTMDVGGQNFELLPFGSGRRICPAWRLGILSVHIFLASLLQGFEWSIPPSHQLDMSECFHFNLRLATPLVAYTSPRLAKQFY